MTEWKKDIRNLSDDFAVDRKIYKKIISETEKITSVPQYYKCKADYLYDVALRKLKIYIRNVLDNREEVYRNGYFQSV